ncbi:MAG: bifunctional hydroxymethylpyrimidine kinase/phosphomethylpyrimidine kinase [Elstera sp.]
MTAVLVIGGTDSSGGAGLAQDCRVLADMGVPARMIVTAVTAQGVNGVQAVLTVPPEMLLAQLDAAASLGPITAIKIGLVPTHAAATLLAERIDQLWPGVQLILDPVVMASAGGALRDAPAGPDGFGSLWARATLITPNLPEIAALLNVPEAPNRRAMLAQAEALNRTGAQAVLLKGGHLPGEAVADCLVTTAGVRWFRAARLPGTRRGTGCALASGIGAGLAQGLSLEAAILKARRWLRASWGEAGECY